MKRLFFAVTPVVLTNPLLALFLGDLVAGDKAPFNTLFAAAFAILASLVLRSELWRTPGPAPVTGPRGEILPEPTVREWGFPFQQWGLPSPPAMTVPLVHPWTLRGHATLVPIVDDGRVVRLAVWARGVQRPP